MALMFNNEKVSKIMFNDTEILKVMQNDVVIYDSTASTTSDKPSVLKAEAPKKKTRKSVFSRKSNG